MARYIDADALKWRYIPLTIQPEEFVTKSDIEKAPTADVVEVVRCKDCKHHGDDHFCCYPWCTTPEEFCSRGERKDPSKVS